MHYELILPEVIKRPDGRFAKGRIPHNKGKKWGEWMPKDSQNRAISGLNRKGTPKNGGVNRIPVVAIKDGRIAGIFKSSDEAASRIGVSGRCIRYAYSRKTNTAGGYIWYKYNDEKWHKYIE